MTFLDLLLFISLHHLSLMLCPGAAKQVNDILISQLFRQVARRLAITIPRIDFCAGGEQQANDLCLQ